MSTNWLPLLGLLALAPAPLQAHDIYSHLVDESGGSCCNDTDCRPAHYRRRATGVDMFIYGHWVAVPSDKIQYRALPGDTGETGGGHWCGTDTADLGDVVVLRCVVLPPNSASVGGPVP